VSIPTGLVRRVNEAARGAVEDFGDAFTPNPEVKY
jgi:hypothetical protein